MMDSSSQLRHQLAADRMAALRRSAEHGPPSSLRRAIGSGLMRVGLRLRGNGRIPPVSDTELPTAVVTPAAVTPTRTGGT